MPCASGAAADSQLLAYSKGRRWHDITSRDINEFVKEVVGGDVTAKDFRTWHGTVVAAVALAETPEPTSAVARRRALRQVAEVVAEQLGNTPAVARKSYMDPRVVDRFDAGETIDPAGAPGAARSRRRAEGAVLRLLQE